MSDFDPREHLSAYIDGELSASELEQVEAALAADSALKSELEELGELVESLGALPPVAAPASLAPAVLERVADLPIPGTAGEAATSSELLTETGQLADIPRLAISAVTGPEGLGGLFRILSGTLWFKVPAGAAVAALMAVGLSYIINPGGMQPPQAEMAMAPQATGPLEVQPADWLDSVSSDATDGVVAVDEEDSDTGDAEDEEPKLLETPSARVRSGGSAGPLARDRSKKRSRSNTPESVVGPDGVYEAAWETVSEPEPEPERAPARPAPKLAEVEEGAAAFGADTQTVTEKKKGSLASTSDVTMAGEPLEDHLDPEPDKEVLREAPVVVEQVGEPDSSSISARGALRGGSGRRSSASRASPSESSLPAAPPVPNILRVGGRAQADRLVQRLERRGWTVASVEQPSALVLSITLPAADEEALLAVLRTQGRLSFGRPAVAVDSERKVFALQLRW